MKLLQRLYFTSKQLEPRVHFYHHQPKSPPNLGDELCSPKHYFNFQSEKPALILGGGAFKQLGIATAEKFNTPLRIAWGVGLSNRLGPYDPELDTGKVLQTYTIATTRDLSAAIDGITLMPCVSALHSIVDLPPGTQSGLILNYGAKASGPDIDRIMEDYRRKGYAVASNALPVTEFQNKFANMRDIVTNSYHAAYWGLLSGRSVRLVGYSTKFISLLDLLGVPQRVISYARGNSEELARGIHLATAGEALQLDNPQSKKDQFRKMNLEFAAGLTKFGIVAHPI